MKEHIDVIKNVVSKNMEEDVNAILSMESIMIRFLWIFWMKSLREIILEIRTFISLKYVKNIPRRF